MISSLQIRALDPTIAFIALKIAIDFSLDRVQMTNENSFIHFCRIIILTLKLLQASINHQRTREFFKVKYLITKLSIKNDNVEASAEIDSSDSSLVPD